MTNEHCNTISMIINISEYILTGVSVELSKVRQPFLNKKTQLLDPWVPSL